MARLVELRVWIVRSTQRISLTTHFSVTDADGADAFHDAVAVRAAAFQPTHFIDRLKQALMLGHSITRVRTRALKPERGPSYDGLGFGLPLAGDRFDIGGFATLTSVIRFAGHDQRRMRTGFRFPTPGVLATHDNEVTNGIAAELEALATDFVTPRILPTTQTLVGAVLHADGSWEQAITFAIGRTPTTNHTRRVKF